MIAIHLGLKNGWSAVTSDVMARLIVTGTPSMALWRADRVGAVPAGEGDPFLREAIHVRRIELRFRIQCTDIAVALIDGVDHDGVDHDDVGLRYCLNRSSGRDDQQYGRGGVFSYFHIHRLSKRVIVFPKWHTSNARPAAKHAHTIQIRESKIGLWI
jgi:hypothetical protein